MIDKDAEEAEETPPGLTPLQSALRTVLLEGDGHVSSVDWPHAYASEALKCSRMVALRLLADDGHNEEVKLSSLLAFSMGDHIHELVQKALAETFADFKPEVRWARPEWNMTGRADGTYTSDDGQRVVVEIKSMTPTMFYKAGKRDSPHAEHVLQTQISALAFEYDAVHLIYVNKAPRQGEDMVLEWYGEADYEGAMLEVERLCRIVEESKTGYVPDRFYDGDIIDRPEKQKWPCQYCNYRSFCLAIGPGERIIPPELLKRPEPGYVRVVVGNDGNIEDIEP